MHSHTYTVYDPGTNSYMPGNNSPSGSSSSGRDDLPQSPQKGSRQLSGRSSSGGGGGGWRGWPRVGPDDLEYFEGVVAPVEGRLLSGGWWPGGGRAGAGGWVGGQVRVSGKGGEWVEG
jgi:hypothetical protein